MKEQKKYSISHDDAKNIYKKKSLYEQPRLMIVKLLANQVLSGGCKEVSDGGCNDNPALTVG